VARAQLVRTVPPPGPSERARRHQLRDFLGLSGEPDKNRAVLIPRFPLSAGAAKE
jgi:hypothetical protein